MDRALNLEFLKSAIGPHDWPTDVGESTHVLPTPEALQDLLAKTEVELFLNRKEMPEELIRTAWFLHGVASASRAYELYIPERQRQAFALSAHIFDIATAMEGIDTIKRLRMTFAAQVGYHRSEGQPNAIAMARRVSSDITSDSPLLEQLPTLALQAGVVMLSTNLAYRNTLRAWSDQLRDLSRQIEVDDLRDTMFGPTYCVVSGIRALARFLTRGQEGQLGRAREMFQAAVDSPNGDGDRDARWVAAHLLFLAGEMADGSIWTVMPPDIPEGAKQAFTLTSPAVLTLWPPQRQLLASTSEVSSALDPSARRVVLSVPTSAGKTLLAQLLMIAHLATTGRGICYVAPQRSLGREVRQSLKRRLRVLAREMSNEAPDFGISDGSELAQLFATLGLDPSEFTPIAGFDEDEEPDIAVMTPERLANALRTDAQSVLNRYSMFVFDEAHLLGEPGRGFLLEWVISFLHSRTRNTDHRMILLSAAMGNAGQLATWIDVDGQPKCLESAWRGPRRLNAIFTTAIDWHTDPVVENVNARGATAHLPRRLTYDLYGELRLRLGTNRIVPLSTSERVGTISFRATANLEREHSPEKRTPNYEALNEIVDHVEKAGPVLVIRTTRKDAATMAQSIARKRNRSQPARQLAEFARIRLGSMHPLVDILATGVAYHHAGLPVDVQEIIEEGVRADIIKVVVATTTLTEGVNLPVRTVILAETTYPGQPEEQQLRGARLVNAMGRAGRATRETEGWVIVARSAGFDATDFDLMTPSPDDLAVRSRMLDDAVLEQFAAFDEALRSGQDAIFRASGLLSDFVAFAWFVLAAEEQATGSVNAAHPIEAFRSTLGYAQLSEDMRTKFEMAVDAVASQYIATDGAQRIRWSKAGTSISSARSIDAIASEISAHISSMDVAEYQTLGDPSKVLEFLEQHSVLSKLLALPECKRQWEFHRGVNAASPIIQVSITEFLDRWIAGDPLDVIANELLADISDASIRLERLVDAVSEFCEHYLSWTLRALLDMVNDSLSDIDRELLPDLPLFIRYGARTTSAVALLLAGIRSREFAARVSVEAASADIANAGLRTWLSAMSIPEWNERLGASPADILDLIDFCRQPGVAVLKTLLSEGRASMPLDQVFPSDLQEVEVHVGSVMFVGGPAQDSISSPLAVYLADDPDGSHVALIPTAMHSEMQAIRETGLGLRYTLTGNELHIQAEDD